MRDALTNLAELLLTAVKIAKFSSPSRVCPDSDAMLTDGLRQTFFRACNNP